MANALNIEDLVKSCLEEIRGELKNLQHVNILVLGRSGVGKSTLINAVFREPLAETGLGRPVTQKIQELSRPDLPLRIYDSRGLELSPESLKQLQTDIRELIEEKSRSGDPDQFIHVIWYVVNTMGNRLEPLEADFLRQVASELGGRVPVLLVLSQAIGTSHTEAMRRVLDAEDLPVREILPVLAKDYPIDSKLTVRSHGLDHLIRSTYALLPEGAQKALNNAQHVDLKLKREQARKCIRAAAGTAFGIGAAPIPGADAPLLIAGQTAMLAKITAYYGVPVNRAMLATLLSAVLGTGTTTVVGRFVASNVLKLIPGAGTVVGGAVSGATGAALTYALGESYAEVLERVVSGRLSLQSLNGRQGRHLMRNLFQENLERWKLRQGKGEQAEDVNVLPTDRLDPPVIPLPQDPTKFEK